MNTYVDIAIIIVLLMLLGYIAFAVVTGGAKDQELDAAFGAAQGASGSKAASQMLRFARPLASLDLVQSQKGTSLGKAIAAKLQASGGMYANSVEVFLSVQVLAVLGGIAGALLGFAGVLHPLIAASLAFFVAIIPYQLVDRRARARSAEIAVRLPEFAELLTMPLSAGVSVLRAIEFTAQRTSGLVSDEMLHMLTLMQTQALSEAQAFDLCGERLGTSESKSLLAALKQAHIQGSRVLDILGSQSEALRVTQYQEQRAAAKRLPITLVLIIGIHLIPLVFVITLIPAAYQLLKI